MINKLLLSLVVALSISACNAETASSSSAQLSPELEAKIEELNEVRETSIEKVKAMNLSKANEKKAIAELNKEVDGVIAGLVMREEMLPSAEEISSSNKQAREQYEKAFGTDEQIAERRRKAKEDMIDERIRQQARRDLFKKRWKEKELRQLEKRDQHNAEYIARLKRVEELADQREDRINRQLEKIREERKASRERMLRIKEARELKRQQNSQY